MIRFDELDTFDDPDTRRSGVGRATPRAHEAADRATSAGPHACFVGRAQELRSIEQAFAAGDRLVTVVGAAGTGKTRLAHEYALTIGRVGQIAVCELMEARSNDDVEHAMAIALAPRRAPHRIGRGARDVIADALAARPDAVVILDGAEPCIEATATRIAHWIRAAPDVRFLVTSRARLDLGYERCILVGPLPMEDAVALFRSRLAAARQGIELGAAPASMAGSGTGPWPRDAMASVDDGLVDAICRRVDGVPLAIELAAARCGVMPLAVLHARLHTGFAVLSNTRRDRPRHHESLRAAAVWSWDLLDDREQAALAQCTVFRGGFGIADAEAILDLEDTRGEREVLDVVQLLIDHSVLHRAAPAADGEPRYDMLAFVRELAHMHLAASGKCPEIERRHALHFVARAHASGDLGAELDNLRAAHAWLRAHDPALADAERANPGGGAEACEPGAIERRSPSSCGGHAQVGVVAVRLAEALASLLVARACRELADAAIEPAHTLLREALALAESTPAAVLRARVLGHLGIAAQLAGDIAGAVAHHGAARELAGALPALSDDAIVFRAHLASVLAVQGAGDHARDELAACREIAERARTDVVAVVDVLDGFCELARSDVALARADRRAAHAQLCIARARLDPSGPARTELCIARRALAMAIAEREARAGVLRVLDGGARFALFDGAPVELAGKPVLRALFAELVDARREAPGRPVPHARLARAVWPEHRGDPAIVINRLRVAMTSLRKLGLVPLVLAQHGGYLLDPAIPIEIDGARRSEPATARRPDLRATCPGTAARSGLPRSRRTR